MGKLREDQRGSFTVEATFVFTISIAVVLALLYVIMFYTDHIFIESKARRMITEKNEMEEYRGILGSGVLKKQTELDIFSAEYLLTYQIPRKFPLTGVYVDRDFEFFLVNVKCYDKEEAELIRMYEALRVRK